MLLFCVMLWFMPLFCVMLCFILSFCVMHMMYAVRLMVHDAWARTFVVPHADMRRVAGGSLWHYACRSCGWYVTAALYSGCAPARGATVALVISAVEQAHRGLHHGDVHPKTPLCCARNGASHGGSLIACLDAHLRRCLRDTEKLAPGWAYRRCILGQTSQDNLSVTCQMAAQQRKMGFFHW